MAADAPFSNLSDDVVLNIFAKLEDDPRNWARLACVSTKFSSLIRHTCCKIKCSQTIPSVVSDLLTTAPSPAAAPPGGWASLHKLAVCCPGLLHAGILLENSDFGLERELGPDENYHVSPRLFTHTTPSTSQTDGNNNDSESVTISGSDRSWTLFDDLYYDTVYDTSESHGQTEINVEQHKHVKTVKTGGCSIRRGCESQFPVFKRRKICRSLRSHLASGIWNLSREQGNKLLASRFRGDCLYISDWPGCVHTEEKRSYMLFRGVFKNFKKSRVWRTINDGNRSKVDLNCAFCSCNQTWDLHSAFCLRRVFGYHDDGDPVVRAYVCENGHVSGAWTDLPLYTVFLEGKTKGARDINLLMKYDNCSLLLAPGAVLVFCAEDFSRHDFPPDFVFGSGTSAYQALEDEYGGWISRKVVKDFTAYADVCFRQFGDRISYWSTFNEANVFVLGGYDVGFTPPTRCSPPFGITNCSKGNSTSEPYIAAHNILLAHASAASLYKNKYQGRQKGFIGINIFAYWFVPYTNATEDVVATQRAKDFMIGWFVNPLVFGDYPDIVKKNAGTRIPAFSNLESKQVKGSFDFIGVNHYFTGYIKNNPNKLKMDNRDFNADMAADMMFARGDTPPDQLPITFSGLAEVLEYFKQVYGNPPIYIHENGLQTLHSSTLDDMPRVKYLCGFIGSLLDALRNGSNARGYFIWSFLDVFELLDGYNSAFGLYYVDMDDKDLKRYPKLSAHWYSKFLKGRTISPDTVLEIETISSISHTQSSQ
ncbi:hypothetical protein RHSIM_Rhsim01G0284600 [Rhododendron simsii]|uniref:F-box domain-containing protein n=1 Tax=Rhododendron simsii TaxID=118357 RepID=A0A834LVS6_RHOSS|nr:hypothetical protein RHSIM_Rhsim01G0284600 [Rhododendron simsii]